MASLFNKIFKKPNKTLESFLALDIGTEYVKAVICSYQNNENNIIVGGYGKCRQNPNAMQGAMIINIENVTKACEAAISLAIQDAKNQVENQKKNNNSQVVIPKKVIIGIAGELVRGVTIIADYEREVPKEKITEKELKEVIKHIKEQAFDDAVIDIAEEIGVKPSSLEEINSKINATYIDGVKVDGPIDFTGKSISYRVFSTFAPSLHVNSLKQVAQNLKMELINIEVEPYAVARAINGSHKETFDAIIIDIGGGTTDVALVKKGAILETKMFAYGGRVFTKRISQDLKIDLNQAEQMKIDYSKKKLAPKQMQEVKQAINKDLAIWSEGLELALKEVEEIDTYPPKIYLCGGASALEEMQTAIIEHPWLTVLRFDKFPKVEYIFPSQLENIIDPSKSINDPSDITPLALARMFLENRS
jgi:cell division protein FtsA